MTEREWSDKVVDIAHRYGWLVAHFSTSLTPRGRYVTATKYDAVGFPDLVLVHERGIVLFRELKAGKAPRADRLGDLTDHQRDWYAALAAAGANVDVWRPSDLFAIASTLSFGAVVEVVA